MVQVMITNGGPHPADKWADTTVEAILALLVDANPDDVSPEALAARKEKRELSPKLFAILLDHHTGVQTKARGDCKKAKKSLKGAKIDVTEHMDGADAVLALLATTPWAAHFARPDVSEIVRQIVGQHTANVIHIERCWQDDQLKGN